MTTEPMPLPADEELLDLLRRHQDRSIDEMASAMSVTATAVRQRLTRLMAQGFIQRSVVRAGRGRPSHRYELTQSGRRQAGSNFGDLAVVLWLEIKKIQDPEVRRGLLQRVSARMAEAYAGQVTGQELAARMDSLAELYRQKRIPFEVTYNEHELPVLNALACPFPDLAEMDRSICAMERLMFTELLGERVELTQCRLDGDACCRFEASKN